MRNIRQSGGRFSCVDVDSLGQYDYIPKVKIQEIDFHGFQRLAGFVSNPRPVERLAGSFGGFEGQKSGWLPH